MNAHSSLLIPAEDNDSRRLLLIGFSILCHVLCLAVLAFAAQFSSRRLNIPDIINVELVSLSAPAKSPGARKAGGNRVNKKAVARKQTIPAVKPESPAAAPLKKRMQAVRKSPMIKSVKAASNDTPRISKPKVKRSLKRKTYKSSVAKSAMARGNEKKRESPAAAKSVEVASTGVAKGVFDRLREKVGGETADRMPAGAAPGGEGARSMTERAYLYQVRDDIKQNWAFSRQLAGEDANLMTALIFKIMPNGEIRDIIFDKRSGNSYLDDSAYKAIIKSNPVRPHPPEITMPFVVVGFSFTPSGVE